MATPDGNGQGPQQQQSAPQQQVVTTGGNGTGQMQAQVQQQAQQSSQQIQMQQATAAQTLQQQHQQQQQQQANQSQQMQQVQLISPQQFSLQNLQQLINHQGQFIIPPGFLNTNVNPQIQVIKPIQNQFTHMLQPGATSYAIPTSGSNNSVGQQYIISNFQPASPIQIQQHQQGKPGEMTKMIGAQIPQGIWPQTLFTANGQNYIVRGTHQDQMYIQPQMTSNATSQHFSMQPLQSNNGQLTTTSIAPVTSAQVQQTIQQGTLQQQQQQQQQAQVQPHAIQPQPNVVSIKAPANLQPKPPPLQIQPNTQQQQQQQQQQTTHQLQHQHTIQPQFQVTMTQPPQQQIQMIPQVSTASMIPQSISISQSSQPLNSNTAQALQQQQQLQHPQNNSQHTRLTLLQQPCQIQNQSIQIIPQPIRPNSITTTGVTVMTSPATGGQATAQSTTTNGLQLPQPRQKIRKTAVPRNATGATATAGGTTILQPPRPGTTLISVPNPQQNKQFQNVQHQQQGQGQVNAALNRLPVTVTSSQQNLQQPQQMVSHLKTINISAIQPNLPDATITPLNPQVSQHHHQQQSTTVQQQSMPPALQVFTTQQVPSPNISITPAPPPQQSNLQTPKKEENKEQLSKGTEQPKANEPEKENNKQNLKSTMNGSNNNNGNEEVEEVSIKQKLPKAMVKPQVLTHVIEGFVIQEASEPFPMPKNGELDEPPKKKSALSGEMGKCEMCGKVDLKAKFKKNKRFCSSQCAKGMKAAQQQAQATSTTISQGSHLEEKTKKNRVRKWDAGMDFTDETNSSIGDNMSTHDDHSAMEVEESPRINPVKWGVSEVVDFVKSLPGCSEYADDFAVQEIDGQALLLLKEDHLMSAIGMKLGPALKLCAKIESLRCGGGNGCGSGGDSGPK